MTEREYGKLVQKMSPDSPMGKDCLNAFWIGGLICTLGQVFVNWYGNMGDISSNYCTSYQMPIWCSKF